MKDPFTALAEELKTTMMLVVYADLKERVDRILSESRVRGEIEVTFVGGEFVIKPVSGTLEYMREEYGDRQTPPRGLWRRYLGAE